MNFAISLIFIAAGWVLIIVSLVAKKFPPKKINNWYGYRTPRSMKNQDTWNEANQYVISQGISSGAALIAFGIVAGLLLPQFKNESSVFFFLPVVILFTFYPVLKTEFHLRKTFDKQGVRYPHKP